VTHTIILTGLNFFDDSLQYALPYRTIQQYSLKIQ
jgi:hypothetical protein